MQEDSRSEKRIKKKALSWKPSTRSSTSVTTQRLKVFGHQTTFSTALTSRRAARVSSISSKAFRQRSNTSQERSWPKEIS